MQSGDLTIINNALHQFKIILEDWIPKSASIAIARGEQYIYFCSGTPNMHLEVGLQVRADSIAYRVLQTRMKTEAVIDNSLFEIPYYVIGYPIYVENQPAALIIVLPQNFIKPKLDTYRFLTGRQNEDWIPIPIDKISHIESLQKKTWFYKDRTQYMSSITLKELQTRLPDSFLRIHRSYIINIQFIEKISRDLTSNFIVVLQDGTELPVSQSYLNNLRSLLEF
ncbi:LytTR family DNA-binding domain-containing protein [Solibacillus sp. CAU 1738]|uniref:LytR/AlgR family response regulator transcription factor n=1 Tax=Solibacillus sp. CAU 1738 TaxID=3140363 RepID=UPI003260B04D